MAEQIPFSIANKVWMKLGSLISRGFGIRYDVGRELVILQEKLSSIKDLVVDSEQGPLPTLAVQMDLLGECVTCLKKVVYEADDLLDDFEAEDSQRTADTQGGIMKQISCFFSSSNQFLFRSMIRSRLEKIIEQLHRISNDMLFLHWLRQYTTRNLVGQERPTKPFVDQLEIVGRDEKKEEIIRFLMQPGNDENLSIVGIMGIAGIGKMALAQLVVNDERVKQHFEVMIWVYFSYQSDFATVTRGYDVGEATMGIDVLGVLLREKLMGKRFLVVLDNAWNEDIEKWAWLRFCMMGGANGSKIIVTTRIFRVAATMRIKSPGFLGGFTPCFLGGLKEYDSCDLFRMRLFKYTRGISPNLP